MSDASNFLKSIFGKLPKKHQVEIRGKNLQLEGKSPSFIRRGFFRDFDGAASFGKQLSEDGYETYFSCSVQKPSVNANGDRQADQSSFAYATCLWTDLDCGPVCLPKFCLPPSFLINSGNNSHAYWVLEETLHDPDNLETVLSALAHRLEADVSCAARTHVLRLPGTQNNKDPEAPKPVFLAESNPHFVYSHADVQAAFRTPVTLEDLLSQDEDQGGRSERDWAVVMELVRAGLSDEAISHIFEYFPCGSKVRDHGGLNYLRTTISNARAKTEGELTSITVKGAADSTGGAKKKKHKKTPGEDTISIGGDADGTLDNCNFADLGLALMGKRYYKITSKGDMQLISSFSFDVQALLMSEGFSPGEQDKLVVNVHATQSNVVWENQVFSQAAFNSATTFRNALTKAGWSWLGSDREVGALLMLLMMQWADKGKPRIMVTEQLGRQIREFKGTEYDLCVTSEGIEDKNGPVEGLLVYDKPPREMPIIKWPTQKTLAPGRVTRIFESLTQVNKPSVVMPALGWFVSTIFKPVLRDHLQVRFPHLHMFGSRGAGKTTLITRVFQPLVGYDSAGQTWPASTTPFVLTALLGSSTSVPVCLTEYRKDTAKDDKFTRLLRVAYDSGQDARGKPDQTTVTYPLTAPVCIDGEDPIDDPAMLERTLLLYLNVETIRKHPEYKKHLMSLQNLPLDIFGANLQRFAMGLDVYDLHDQAQELTSAFENRVPSRIVSNLTVITMGLLALQEYAKHLEIICPFEVTEDALHFWYNDLLESVLVGDSGRTELPVDTFVTDVLNHILVMHYENRDQGSFNYRIDNNSNTMVAFHLKTAHDWWCASRSRMRESSLPLSTIRRQLKERTVSDVAAKEGNNDGHYVVGSKRATTSNNSKVMLMQYVDVTLALRAGLDIAEEFGSTVYSASTGTKPSASKEQKAEVTTEGKIKLSL